MADALDLALLGSAGVLDDAVVLEILGGERVSSCGPVLCHLFAITRAGVDGAQLVAFVPLRPPRQMAVNDDSICDIGHWKHKGGMPRDHDSAACVPGLRTKNGLRSVFANGWKVVESGCAANPAPVPDAAVDTTAPVSTTKRSKEVPVDLRSETSDPLLSTWLVLHKGQKRSHLLTGSVCTVCNQWRCGTPENPSVHAVFTTEGSANNCMECRKCRSLHSVIGYMEAALVAEHSTSASADEMHADDDSSSATSSTSSSIDEPVWARSCLAGP